MVGNTRFTVQWDYFSSDQMHRNMPGDGSSIHPIIGQSLGSSSYASQRVGVVYRNHLEQVQDGLEVTRAELQRNVRSRDT